MLTQLNKRHSDWITPSQNAVNYFVSALEVISRVEAGLFIDTTENRLQEVNSRCREAENQRRLEIEKSRSIHKIKTRLDNPLQMSDLQLSQGI